MKFGDFEFTILSDGIFWLDGGAMFGVVPKVLWNKLNPADDLNRIALGLNCLLVQTKDSNVLIDTGIGTKLKDRFKDIYRIERESTFLDALSRTGLEPDNIDTVINTHLHFDHCGGNTIEQDGALVPTFPRAKYIIQKKEWEDAVHPNDRTKASYLKENFIPLEEKGQLILVDGDQEIMPGIRVIVTNGHTRGHQSIVFESEGRKAIYLGDFIPTASHIRIPYVMGYDLFPIDLVEKKKEFLKTAVREKWLLIFEHDPRISFAYVTGDIDKPILQSVK